MSEMAGFFLSWYGAHGHLHSFPTRRSSDLARPDRAAWAVQRLLAAAATLSATGSASPRPDSTSGHVGIRVTLCPPFRAGALYTLARGCRRIWRGEKLLTRSASQ